MKVESSHRSSQSHHVEEHQAVELHVEPPAPKKAEPNLAQQRLNQDRFEADAGRNTLRNTLLGGATFQAFQSGLAGSVSGGVAGQVSSPASVAQQGGGQVSPGVQAAIDEINKFQPQAQAIGLSIELSQRSTNSPEDVAFRRELMNALGPDRVAGMMSHLRRDLSQGPRTAHNILSAAYEAYSPADQGKVVQGLGTEMLGRTLAQAVDHVSIPNSPSGVRTQLENVSKLVGNVYALPAGSPGRTEVTGALERIQNGQQFTSAPGVSTAAWIVANSGNDQLRNDFANKYLDELKANPDSLSPTEARAVAWALGSTTGSPATGGVDPIVNLTDAQRTQFLAKLTTAGRNDTPELRTGVNFQNDVRAGVEEFLLDVTRINPANFSNGQAARELRIETFQQVSKSLDSEFFDAPGTHYALASMFAVDTEGIVNTSANTSHRLNDQEGQALASFFDHVAFRSEGSRHIVTEALQKYLGVGDEQGLVDELSENKGNTEFMQRRGNVLARNMGFVLGALYQGSQSAVQRIEDEQARKKAIVDVMGSLVETAIDASPVSAAYDKIKSGTGDRASVSAVFDWIGGRFTQSTDASKDAVKKLAGAVIEGAWAPFFGDEALQGADPQEITAMFALINAGVARADGREGDPNINIGGAYID